MGKKKGQGKNYKDDAPPEFTDSQCPHTRKGLDLSQIKKALQDGTLNACQDCKGGGKEGDNTEIENIESPLIWVCLKCGYRGCGRYSDQQHAVKHFEKPHSDPHCLVVSLENWNIWCYLCDGDVQYSSTGRLSQLVTYIQKQTFSEPTRKTTNKTVKEHENQIQKLENKNEQQKDSKKGGTGTEEKEKEKPHKEIPLKNTSLTVKGFSNLGNTCFFNAVMQILSQTKLLRELLKDLKNNETTIKITPHLSSELGPITINVDKPGPLTLAMCQFLTEIQETKKSVVTPKELFSQVCKKAARFKGFQQQDSQELLRYLLDGMRSEEIKRKSAGIFKTLNDSGKQVDAEESKKLVKEYEKKGELQNFVDQVFGGELTSTIMCEECKTISLVTEMFLDLSLPVSDEAYRKKSLKKSERKPSINEDEDYDVSPAWSNNADNGIPTATCSKYQLKKDKKHAKKQAKNQRRQQKHEGKVGLAHATEQNSEEHQNGQESSSQGNLSQPDTENLTELSVCTDSSEPVLQNEKEVSDTELCEDTSSAGHDHANEHTEAEKNTDGQQLDPLENSPEPSNSTTVNFKEFTPDENLVQGLSKISLNDNIVCHDDIELDIGNCDGPFDAREYTVANQDPEVAFCTLADRELPGKQESSTQSCLYQFTQKEKLTGTNRLRCNTCSQRKYKEPKSNLGDKKIVYTDAQKQMLISMAPPVLTLHLKRFQQVGYSACKVNKHVQFPQILDLAPFCTVNCKNVAGDKGVLYSLYGIVEHSGTMRSGHYTAYVKVKPNCHLSEHLNGMTPQVSEAESLKGSWFHISDSSVQAVPESKVQNSQAYLLFYERILHQTHGDKH